MVGGIGKLTKVVIAYRVLQAWRIPVFERLAALPDIDLTVLYGEDFAFSKVKSAPAPESFNSKCLKGLKWRLRTSNGEAFIPFSPSLFGELVRLRPDVIVAEGASNFLNNIVCFVYAKLYRKKIIQWGLGEIQGRKLSLHRRLLNLVFNSVEKMSDAVICYSSVGSGYYRRLGLRNEKIFVAVNVVDTEKRFRDLREYCSRESLEFPSPLPKRFEIIFVGAVTTGKNVETLIEAYQILFSKVDPALHHLTIVGDGDRLEKIRRQVADSGLAANVTFTGHVGSGIERYFYGASVFVLPGLGGLAVSDALSHGVPVICTVGDGCEQDLVRDGDNGYFLPTVSPEILAAKLQELLSNREKLGSLRKNAQQFVHGEYTIREYVSVVKEAIDACVR